MMYGRICGMVSGDIRSVVFAVAAAAQDYLAVRVVPRSCQNNASERVPPVCHRTVCRVLHGGGILMTIVEVGEGRVFFESVYDVWPIA